MRLKRKSILGSIILGLMISLFYLNQGSLPLAAQIGTGTLRVASTGNDVVGCGAEASPCKTIQFAVNQVPQGSTAAILVAAGTYTYNTASDVCSGPLNTTGVVCVVNKEVTILGGYTTANWTNANPKTNETIIDGGNTYRGVYVVKTGPTTSLHMEGFTIQNGRAGGIPGVDVNAFGGGLFADLSGLTLKHLVFKNNQVVGDNRSDAVGGAAGGGGLSVRNAPTNITLEHLTFEGNQALAGSGNTRGGFAIGGAVHTLHTTGTGRYITMTNNIATAGSTTGAGNVGFILGDAEGGGFAVQEGSNITLEDVQATENIATGGAAPNGNGGSGYGGAFFAEKSTLSITDGDIFDNLAQGGDGLNTGLSQGIATGFGQGGGVAALEANITFDRTQWIKNIARSGNDTIPRTTAGAGGLAIIRLDPNTPITVKITNNIIADNAVILGAAGTSVRGGGGGLWLQGTPADVVHTTIANNTLSQAGLQGQGVVLLPGDFTNNTLPAILNLAHSIVAGHTSTPDRAIHAQANNTVNINQALFAGNTDDTNDGEPQAGMFTGLGTIITSASAGFQSPEVPDYNYHITSSSSARDKATGSTTEKDIDGEDRPQNGISDLGADEVYPGTANPSTSSKTVSPSTLRDTDGANHQANYTITLRNMGNADITTGTLIDTLSSPLTSITLALASGPTCSSGTCSFNGGTNQITWEGSIPSGGEVSISYTVNVTLPAPGTLLIPAVITNEADLDYTDSEGNSGTYSMNAQILVNPSTVYLPLIIR